MATKLRSVHGRGAPDNFGLRPETEDLAFEGIESNLGQPVLRRPGDHIETLWVDDIPSLEELRMAARTRQVHPDTAIGIVLERRIAVEVLGRQSVVAHLDRLSNGQVPEIELWSAHSAYLRHILHGSRIANSFTPSDPRRISVPIRLIDRLASAIPSPVESVEIELSRSISWEVAALLRSETLSEWAYRSALDFCKATPQG